MVAHDSLQRRRSRANALDASAEASEKMRFDEAGDDPHISFDNVTVDQRGRAVARRAELDMLSTVLRLMVEHAVITHDLRSQHRFQLVRRVRPMRTKLV